jgi:hypothetical protein
MVRLPDTTGQLRSAKGVPVRVLRGFFSGIGQLLLAADRFRAEEAQREAIEHDERDGPPTGLDGDHAPRVMMTVEYAAGTAHEPADSRTSTGSRTRRKGRSARPRTFRSLDSTGNVRVLTPEMPAESSSEGGRPAPKTRRRKAVRAAKTAGSRTTAPAPPAAKVSLPVPGYDGLSFASLRARLRNLDATQVRTLLEHEKSAGNRADVVGMLERRVAKLEATHDAP